MTLNKITFITDLRDIRLILKIRFCTVVTLSCGIARIDLHQQLSTAPIGTRLMPGALQMQRGRAIDVKENAKLSLTDYTTSENLKGGMLLLRSC